ncbi:efflux RND transporter periplasmic adaptor subunit [Pseudoalteromonas sp. S16_S37]|uniref:efflux RND transporter periplasmic adaptor subunit n=1 Tax=Pseudoalteromonas sp. S16_S37 TaxID=2720228 RepID=UPI0016816FD7|nr:HlyD family efflux transporter periplasmic adaptor subunit [Pseudoalteromonas sp. S16_S37]MBD1581964.1 HlyD family efflux transporter periplasmic adaptor subunit [Pseudoalteromonas sp. S16_S37]
MDIAISAKKTTPMHKYILACVAIVIMLFAAYQLWQFGRAELTLKADSLVISQVQRGDFTVTVRGNGVLVPEKVQWLSASGDAKVEALLYKPGQQVRQGDEIVRLTNPRLEQELGEAKWELSALEAEHKASDLAEQAAIAKQRSDILNAQMALAGAEHEYQAHQELIATGAVSKLDFQRAKIALEQAQQALRSAKVQMTESTKSWQAQQHARFARLNQLKNRVSRIQTQVNELTVRASIDSIILALPVEVGQHVSMGSNIAKLANQNALIAELQIPEIQIQQIAVGQKVTIDTQNNQVLGHITRIDPEVVQGNVQVDVAFTQPLPSDARPALSVNGEIVIAQLSDTLYVSRPLFSQSQTQSSIYKLSSDGLMAERTAVQLGLGSVSYVQIIQGLQEGDQVVTSDPSRFESYTQFRIN